MASMGPPAEMENGSATSIVNSRLRQVAVVIPAWMPNDQLSVLVPSLEALGLCRIVIVDDGSGAAYAPVFNALAARASVTLYRHDRNRGKGCALKTAFGHLQGVPDLLGVVTADADGQHTPDCILRVAEALLEEVANRPSLTAPAPSLPPSVPRRNVQRGLPRANWQGRPVLGIRSFRTSVPWRSRVGNLITNRIFATLSGCRLHDTQTGLRGLPAGVLPLLLHVSGERYEYEMAALAALCTRCGVPRQVAIETVYLEGNRESHFRPLRDSVRVYLALVRAVLLSWPPARRSRTLIHNTERRPAAFHSA